MEAEYSAESAVSHSVFLFLSGLKFLSVLEVLAFSSSLDSLSSSSTTFSTPDGWKFEFHLKTLFSSLLPDQRLTLKSQLELIIS